MLHEYGPFGSATFAIFRLPSTSVDIRTISYICPDIVRARQIIQSKLTVFDGGLQELTALASVRRWRCQWPEFVAVDLSAIQY